MNIRPLDIVGSKAQKILHQMAHFIFAIEASWEVWANSSMAKPDPVVPCFRVVNMTRPDLAFSYSRIGELCDFAESSVFRVYFTWGRAIIYLMMSKT